MSADELGLLLISAEVMGLEHFYETFGPAIRDIITGEQHFSLSASCLSSLRYLKNLQLILQNSASALLPPLLERCYCRTVELMDDGKNAGRDDEKKAAEALRSLYAFTVEESNSETAAGISIGENDEKIFADKVEEILDGGFCNSRFYGALLAIHEKQGRINSAELGRRINARLASSIAGGGADTGGEETASFIAGVFLVGRDILFAEPDILKEIDKIVSMLDDEAFLAALPHFRYAFTSFLPQETGRLGHMVADLYHLDGDTFAMGERVSEQDLKLGMMLDKKAAEAMSAWGLYND
jgi:hypothetical protein